MNEQDWWKEQDLDAHWAQQQEEELRRYEEESDEPLHAEGFEEALIGYGVQFDQRLAIYDYARCVRVLVERYEMTEQEAIEHMEYNVLGAYVGRRTPVFLCVDNEPEEDAPVQLTFKFTFGDAA